MGESVSLPRNGMRTTRLRSGAECSGTAGSRAVAVAVARAAADSHQSNYDYLDRCSTGRECARLRSEEAPHTATPQLGTQRRSQALACSQ